LQLCPSPAPDKPLTAIGLLEHAREFRVPLVQFADNLPLDRLSEDGHCPISVVLARIRAVQFTLGI
jgi:hypothetical protein